MSKVFEKAVAALKEKHLTVTFAESCTGGLLCKSITDVPGASNVFHGGAVTYSNDIKISVVNVSAETIEKYTEVSRQTAREMAEGVRAVFGADIAVSATGYAGPGGGTEENPVCTVYVGVAGKDGVSAYRLYYPGRSREQIRELVTAFAAYAVECEAARF
ncbi:MAG: CinA family protein [Clostridia bacterium]|nr:CinA family protein [Clostridia bacterium]